MGVSPEVWWRLGDTIAAGLTAAVESGELEHAVDLLRISAGFYREDQDEPGPGPGADGERGPSLRDHKAVCGHDVWAGLGQPQQKKSQTLLATFNWQRAILRFQNHFKFFTSRNSRLEQQLRETVGLSWLWN